MGYSALVDQLIDPTAVLAAVADPAYGAQVLFLGVVRDHHAGRKIAAIDYTAYRAMAAQVLAGLVAASEAEGVRAALVHRLGRLLPGETSVAIATASAHRQAAYDMSRVLLERLKREAPIWKLEVDVSGAAIWREDEPLTANPSP